MWPSSVPPGAGLPADSEAMPVYWVLLALNYIRRFHHGIPAQGLFSSLCGQAIRSRCSQGHLERPS